MKQLYVITGKNNIIKYIKNIYYIILTMNIDEIITKNKILEEELQKTKDELTKTKEQLKTYTAPLSNFFFLDLVFNRACSSTFS